MVRVIVGTVLAGALVAARAAADALPHDPATGKSIDGAAVLLDLEKYPDYTFLILDGGCFSDGDDDEDRLRREVGDERGGCGYRLAAPGVAYKGVSQDAPNAEADEFVALPAERFPVKDGTVPALDKLPLATLLAWRGGEPDSPLVNLGAPPDFIELHRFSERVGYTEYLRVSSPCGAPALQRVRTEWQLESGEVITQAHAAAAPSCEAGSAVPGDRLGRAEAAVASAAAPTAVAVAGPVNAVAAVAIAGPVVAPVAPVAGPDGVQAARSVAASAGPVDMFEETSRPRFGARELGLGGVCLLVGLGAGLALRRRRAR